jgi:hypothetical protein
MAEEKEKKSKAVMYTVIVIIGIIVIFAIAGSSNQSNNNQVQNNQTSAQPAVDPTQLANLKSKCASDGEAYYKKYQLMMGNSKMTWFDPSYHYNLKMNTCLVYIGWVTETGDNGLMNYDNTLNTNYAVYATVYNFVFDVYQNQTLLQSISDRTTTNGGNTDVPAKYPLFTNMPNLDVSAFNNQYSALFN